MTDIAKQAAGRAAAELVVDGMLLGLGTGSTVRYFLESLAERELDVRGIPTSHETEELARALGLGLADPHAVTRLDLCVDGADELTADLALTKGGGGALLREKVVAEMSDRMVVIATPDKVVDRLGDSFALPVEVVEFAAGPVRRRLEARGYEVSRRDGDTVNGNVILDARMPGGIADPVAESVALALIAGIAEHGLFVGVADEALLGTREGTVQRLRAAPADA